MFLRACGTRDDIFFQNCSASNAFSYHKVLGISLSWPGGGSCYEGGIGSQAADSPLAGGGNGSSVRKGQTKTRSRRPCGKSRGRAEAGHQNARALWWRQEEGRHEEAQGRFGRTRSHENSVPMCLGVP